MLQSAQLIITLAKVNLLHEGQNEPVLTVFIHLVVTVLNYQVGQYCVSGKKKKFALIVRCFGRASTAALSQLLALHSPDPAGKAEVMQERQVNIKAKQIKPSSVYPFSSTYPRTGHGGNMLSRVL